MLEPLIRRVTEFNLITPRSEIHIDFHIFIPFAAMVLAYFLPSLLRWWSEQSVVLLAVFLIHEAKNDLFVIIMVRIIFPLI